MNSVNPRPILAAALAVLAGLAPLACSRASVRASVPAPTCRAGYCTCWNDNECELKGCELFCQGADYPSTIGVCLSGPFETVPIEASPGLSPSLEGSLHRASPARVADATADR